MTCEEFFEKYDWYIEAIKNGEAVELSYDGENWELMTPVGFNYTQSHPFKSARAQFRFARKPKPKKYRVKSWPEIAMWLCENLTSVYGPKISGKDWNWIGKMKETCGDIVLPNKNGPYHYHSISGKWEYLPEWVEEAKDTEE